MIWTGLGAAAAAALAVALTTESGAPPTAVPMSVPPKPVATATLAPFKDEAELGATITKLRAKLQEVQRAQRRKGDDFASADASAASAEAPTFAGDAAAEPSPAAPPMEANARAAAKDEEAITNVQTAGVDEGGIVKRRGDHLIVLRRGRLFTVRIGGDELKPISMVDAYGPGIDPGGAWYDEMLVSGNTVVVVGYSYQRGGTEIGLFDLDGNGGLKYRGTYHLRSNDYYSSRNYASRLIGDKLIFYAPAFVNLYNDSVAYADNMPALRRWHAGAEAGDFKRILPAERIYRGHSDPDPEYGLALHTVSVCDLSAPEMDCTATAVMGPPGQVFYVSEDSAYVWTASWDWRSNAPKEADVFRIPLDGSAPTAMRAKGTPIDQMSFLQQDGYLNVLLSAQGNGQWMWDAESEAGDMALMRVPLTMFGDGSVSAESRHYRPMPAGALREGGAAQNRYVGDWLLVGAGRSWRGDAAPTDAFAIRYATNEDFQRVQVGHGIERIDALGRDGIVIGQSGDDLHFTSLALDARAAVAGKYVLPHASQGEQRTHGFFYRATGEREGVVGLPVLGQGGARGTQASVLFLHNRALRMNEAGRLDARAGEPRGDDCKASCVDWYGNARPIFIGERVFALLGYELVEGRFEGERIRERRRVDFSPVVSIAR